jgi:hypothetical protein
MNRNYPSRNRADTIMRERRYARCVWQRAARAAFGGRLLAESQSRLLRLFLCFLLEILMMVANSRGIAPWPASLDAYDYLRTLNRRDWAWEGLRRNPAYQRQALACPSQSMVRENLGSGALFTRMQGAEPAAEAWALCCFRRSHVERACGPSRVVAAARASRV